MALITVLIPTFDHTDTIRYAINSVMRQSIQDFEIIVVGDGAPSRTDEIMHEICADDSRISYIPNKKDIAQGEIYRHQALHIAKGEYVCYLSDDDLWLPKHLETMIGVLREKDFCHTLHINVNTNQSISALGGTLTSAFDVHNLLARKGNFFGLSFTGHTMAAYHKLPEGWRPRPEGTPCDLHMWRQWLEQPWVNAGSSPVPSVLHFPSPHRKGWTTEQRTIELKHWFEKINNDGFHYWLCQEVIKNWRERVRPFNGYLEVAKNFVELEKWDKAEEYFKQSIKVNPDHPVAYVGYIKALNKQAKAEEALTIAKHTQKLFPDKPHILNLYLNLLIINGNLSKATEVLEGNLSRFEFDARIHYQYSRTLNKLGNHNKAVSYARKAIDLDPDNSIFKTHLTNLIK